MKKILGILTTAGKARIEAIMGYSKSYEGCPRFVDKACKISIPQNKIMCVYGYVVEAFDVSCVQCHRF